MILHLPLEKSDRTCTSSPLIVHSEVAEVAQTWCTELRGGRGGACICIPSSVSPFVRTVSFPCWWFMPGDRRRPVNGIFLFALLMNNNMSKRKIKTANSNGCRERDKQLDLASMMQREREKGFPSSALCVYFLHDANLLKEQNRLQHMDFCPTNWFSFRSPKQITIKWQFSSSLFIFCRPSLGEILV